MRKIYNKIKFNMSTGETIEEDYFMYSGPMALCEGEVESDPPPDKAITLGDVLPEDMRGDKLPGSLKDFAGIQIPGKDADETTTKEFHGKLGSILKGFADTKAFVGKSVQIPGKDAKPEELQAFNSKINELRGVPKKAEDYKIDAPVFDGNDKRAIFDEKLLNSFKEKAHAEGYTAAQVQAAVNFQAEIIRDQIMAMDRAAEKGKEALRKEFGDEYDGLMEGAELTLSKFFSEDAREKIKMFGIGNDPDFVRGLIDLHKATAEAGSLKGLKEGKADDATVKGLQDEIDKLMSSKEYINGDKAVHEKVSELFVKKQKAQGVYKENVRSSKVEV